MLSAQERAHIAQVWDLIAGHEAQFGAELLLRSVEAGSPGAQGGGDEGFGRVGRQRHPRSFGCGSPGLWTVWALVKPHAAALLPGH